MSINIGQNIKKLRELRNFTQTHMAKVLEMTQQNYSKLETGEIEITVNRLQQIAEVLQTKPENIFSFDDKTLFSNNYWTFSDSAIGIGQITNEYLINELKQVHEKHLKNLQQEILYLRNLLEKTLTK